MDDTEPKNGRGAGSKKPVPTGKKRGRPCKKPKKDEPEQVFEESAGASPSVEREGPSENDTPHYDEVPLPEPLDPVEHSWDADLDHESVYNGVADENRLIEESKGVKVLGYCRHKGGIFYRWKKTDKGVHWVSSKEAKRQNPLAVCDFFEAKIRIMGILNHLE